MIQLRQKSAISFFIQFFFVVLIICGIFSIIWLRSGITSIEYTISELENRKLDRLNETKTLLADRATALSMQKMEKAAVRDLGLVLADRTKVVYVKAVNTGPSKVSLDKKYGGLNTGGGVFERTKAQSGVVVREARVSGDSHIGGYQ
ncbi:MAG TPA: hypothetical protein VN328_12355 [Thermodesulfovibrionales bacterium]|nr:hypothetical protein [Thermodesulfovibrionales bacterium]